MKLTRVRTVNLERATALCGWLCFFVVAVSLLSASGNFSAEIPAQSSLEIHPIAAVAFALLAVRLIAGSSLSFLWLSGCLIVFVYSSFEILRYGVPFYEGLASVERWINQLAVFVGPQPAPQVAFALLLLSASALLVKRPIRFFLETPLIIAICFFVFGIGLSGIFGYLLGVPTGYQLGSAPAMSLAEACEIMFIGAGLACALWLSFYRQVSSIQDLWRSIAVSSTFGVLITALLSAAFIALPFYDVLIDTSGRGVSQIARFASLTLDEEFNEIESDINQIQVSQDAVALWKSEIVEEIIKESNSVVGLLHFKDGELKESFGRKIQLGTGLPRVSKSSRPYFFGPSEHGGTSYIFAAVQGEKYYELYIIDLKSLLLRFDKKEIQGAYKIYLVGTGGSERRIYRFNFKKDTIDRTGTKTAHYIRSALESYSEKESPTEQLSSKKSLIAVSKAHVANFNVVVSADSQSLFSELNSKVVKFLSLAVLIALVASLGTFYLLRDLVQASSTMQDQLDETARTLQASLDEKELLLKEIHHRVKNNLQVISSLFQLQGRRLQNDEAKDALQESQHRVASIAILHELLYQSGKFAEVDFRVYVESLLSKLLQSYGKTEEIDIDIDTADVCLSLDEAIPCGLLITEIVTNSLKHAYENGRKGKIQVKARGLENGMTEIIVQDDGKGFDAEVLGDNTGTLGRRLMQSLSQQLGGELELLSGTGTGYRLQF